MEGWKEMHKGQRWRLPAFVGAGIAAAVLLRHVLAALAVQVAAGAALMLLALPLCHAYERRIPPGAAAALSLLTVAGIAAVTLVTLVPPVVRQVQQLVGAVPTVLEGLRAQGMHVASWLDARGIDILPVREMLFGQITGQMGAIVSRAMGFLMGTVEALGKVLLSPLLAFYLLRDRKRIASAATLLLPVKHRARGVRAAREMRRETAAFLRGQLLLSGAVGGLTSAALLLTGTPGWLLLGVLMGVMELVPYVGPFLAGVPAVLLALQNGIAPALWTAGALALVQQVEGTFLSPRLLAGATQLHPMAVLMLVSAGGMIGGAWGMVAVIPLVVSVRGLVRGWRD